MLRFTSRSKVVMGIVFAMSGLTFLVDGKMIFAGIWFFCSVVHFFDAYRMWIEEKNEK